MNKKMKYFMIGGIILTIINEAIIKFATTTCEGGLACAGLGLFITLPGVIIANTFSLEYNTTFNFISNTIFYFIIGGLIGLVVERIKRK